MSPFPPFLLPIFSLLLSLTTTQCFPTSSKLEHRTFIINVNYNAKPSIFPTHQHWYQSSLNSISSSLSLNTPKQILHTYDTVFHGFSAHLTNSEANLLSQQPHILSLIPEQVRSLHTTRSPLFLGLESSTSNTSSLLEESDFGSDLVVGVLDTGIWPEHSSFNDHGLNDVPFKWRGTCVIGFPCNKKIIGAKFYCQGYEATNGKMNETTEFRSPRDSDGHGSHTASIAAGRYVFPADTLGYAKGIASGMAPKARVAVYKVCWTSGCYDSDILNAFDEAVKDGVDVISLSVGGVVVPYFLDSISVAAFGAVREGVFVSASAGNGGPGGSSVTNVAPWVTTVGAGSIDRDFPAEIVLGNGRIVEGMSVYSGHGLVPGKLYPVYYAGVSREGGGGGESGDGYSASLCLDGSLDPNVVKGKIVLCDRGINSRVVKGQVVKDAGGIGMILANAVFDGEGLVADCHVLPATAVGSANGDVIRSYISDSLKEKKVPLASMVFQGTRIGVQPAPVVAAFSARGPNPQSPEILKPDLIAPGLNILASWTQRVGPSGLAVDKRRAEFNILSGTSMACPHVSGLAALLKAAHPEWSPAAIRSALMTTAYIVDNQGGLMKDESTGNESTMMDFGAGHVHPLKAMDPGLVYDLTIYDYIDFLCNSNYTIKNINTITGKNADCKGAKRAGHVGNLNYPTLSYVFVQYGQHKMSSHSIRIATNVGEPDSVYRVKIHPPMGTNVTVKPEVLRFRRVGQKLNFLVRVQVEAIKLAAGSSVTRSGSIIWSDGKHSVTSPLVVTMQEPL